MRYKHLSIFERNKIEVLHCEGYSARKIANILGFHHSTISRELKRCNGDYKAGKSENNRLERASKKGRYFKISSRIISIIKEKLESKWSPEQISNTVLKGEICFKTIYNWLYNGHLDFDITKLRRKGKSKKPKETRGKFNIGTSINKRPKIISKRSTFGHWELDTIVSSRGKSKGCLATFVERKTRFYIAIPMIDRTKESMLRAITKLLNGIPIKAFQSFTSDRGKEFSCYKEIEEMGIEFYFADAYSAWQRGSNENSNGLLRQYYPKKTNLSKIEENELIQHLIELNTRPRKCLNYKTPMENFLHELSIL